MGPASIRSFFGVGDDENPGFSQYPSSKSQILATARRELEDVESDPRDLEWLSKVLPERTYADRSDVLAALSAVVEWPEDAPTAFIATVPMHAMAIGTKLVVGPHQTATLLGRDGKPLDQFEAGEHVINRQTAPRAAAVSRPPAPGFPKSTIVGAPYFASTQERRVTFDRTASSLTGQAVRVLGSLAYVVRSLPDFLRRIGPRPRGLTSAEIDAEVGKLVASVLDSSLATHDAAEQASSKEVLERALQSGAVEAGIQISSVAFDSVTPLSAIDQMTAIQDRQRQAMAHLPPEAQARIQAQMAAAVQRARAARPSTGPPAVAPATVPSTSRPTAATQLCPACHAANPASSRFCGNCGRPLASGRTCAQCGTEVPAGVKFCGNCGTPLG